MAERQSRSSIPDWSPEAPLLPDLFYEFGNAPLAFQMGVPAQDCEQEFRLRRPLGVMSASLIGPLGSSTFRLSTNAVSMSLAGSCFSSESAPGPFHHGFRGRGGTICWAALPSLQTGGPSRHTNSPHPSSRKGTSFHRVVELQCPPISFDPA